MAIGSVQAAEAFSSSSSWMLGDWGGVRSELLEKGYSFTLGYVGEGAANIGGGYSSHKTGRYTDQLLLGTTLDLQKILGWNNAEFQLSITERNGHDLSQENIGDPRSGMLSSAQEVWGRGQTWRLTQAWYRQSFFDNVLDLKLGRVTVGEDFGTFSCKFQNLTFCGSQVGDWAGDIIYNWPVSQWGGRAKLHLSPDTYFQVGVYEQNPSYLETGNGFKLSGSGGEGLLIPIEAVHQIHLGSNDLLGVYRVGAYTSSRTGNDVYRAADGNPLPLSNASPKEHDGKYGGWIVAQQQVYRDPQNAARALTFFANFTMHDQATSFIDRYASVGAFYTAPFDSRPDDEIGVGISTLHVNSRVRNRQELSNEVSGIWTITTQATSRFSDLSKMWRFTTGSPWLSGWWFAPTCSSSRTLVV
jgi:porin